MAIEPDLKDWTWVLERPCPDCCLNAGTLSPTEIVAALRANAAAWRPALSDLNDPSRRPADDVWSPLEYACHVRDVFRLFDQRLALMLTQDNPTFPSWDQDETAVSDAYNQQDVSIVLDELEASAEVLARSFERVDEPQWQRTSMRSDGARFTVETFGRYMVHDPVHHLYDIEPGP